MYLRGTKMFRVVEDDRGLKKEGHVCCFCFCDTRRAVIVVNIFSIVDYVISITWLISVFVSKVSDTQANNRDSWESQEDWENWKTRKEQVKFALSFLLADHAAGFIFAAFGMMGAILYRWSLVGLTTFFIFANYFVGSIFQERFNEEIKALEQTTETDSSIDIGMEISLSVSISPWIMGGIITALFLYPHVALLRELLNGTMTAETYHSRERHSCCCTE